MVKNLHSIACKQLPPSFLYKKVDLIKQECLRSRIGLNELDDSPLKKKILKILNTFEYIERRILGFFPTVILQSPLISTIKSTRRLLIAMNQIEQNQMPPEEEEEDESFSSTQIEYPDSPVDT